MRFFDTVVVASAVSQAIGSAVPNPNSNDVVALLNERLEENGVSHFEDLWKRKGGGGGGGRGGSSSGGRSGSSSSSSSGRGSTTSNSGGRTTTGSGPQPAFGGGRYYGGGASVPYKAGSRSPSGISPGPLLLGAGLGFWSAHWLYGAYHYPYQTQYWYHNRTTDKNETKPVGCLCDPYQECGCDDNGNQTYFQEVIGDGSYANLNKSLVDVGPVNGTDTILINGTLPNGTTAPGGDEDPFSAAAGMQSIARAAGWWPVVTTVIALVYLS